MQWWLMVYGQSHWCSYGLWWQLCGQGGCYDVTVLSSYAFCCYRCGHREQLYRQAMSLRKVFCGVRIVYVHFGKRIVSCTLSRTLCGLCQSPYTYAYTCTHIYIYIHIHAEGMQKYTHLYVRVYLSLYTDKYVHNIYIYISDYGGLLLGFCLYTG